MQTLHPAPVSSVADPVRLLPLVLGVHALLGLAADRSAAVATLHALITVVVAGLVAVQTRQLVRVAQVVAYLSVADVLWRSTGALFFWEGVKYAVVVVLLIALLRFFRSWRSLGLPVFYLAMFLPAVLVSVVVLGPTGLARGLISANLSGPLVLAVAVAFFSQVRVTVPALRSVFVTMLGPIMAISAVAGRATLGSGPINFGGESNFVTAGGFGPNQVSALLGLGTLLCVLLALTEPLRRRQLLLMCLGLTFLVQAMLTFSRGGVISLALAMVAMAVALARHSQAAARLAALLVGLGLVVAFVVLPQLDTFTGGAFEERYSDLGSNRGRLVQRDVEIFQENPFGGAGAGVASLERGDFATEDRVAAHTEFSRLLAEQGILGLFALLAMVAIAVRACIRAEPGFSRAVVLAAAVWSLSEMSHSAMRVATIPFVFALAVAAQNMRSRPSPGVMNPHGSVGARAAP